MPARTVRAAGASLGLIDADISRFVAAEAAAAVIDAIRRPGFRPDCRWIAAAAGVPLDHVNIALHTLISGARLQMVSRTEWIVSPGSCE